MIAQIVHLAANRFHAGQLRVAVTFLGDQLAPHRWRCQPRVQPLGLKRGIRLTLGVHEGSNVGEQMRQVFLAPFASACGEGIHAGDASSQFVHAFTNRASVPTQLAFGRTLPLDTQQPNRACHEQTALAPFQLLGRGAQVFLDDFREFHEWLLHETGGAILLG